MPLQTTGEVTVDADRQTAFAFVRDAERLARCIPGCQQLQEIEPGRRYSAVLTSRVAFITISFKVMIDVVNVEPPTAIDAKITGDAIGLLGHVVANAGVRLADAGDARTRIGYVTDVTLTGKLGGIGQPVFRATSAQLGREFAANLKAAIEAVRTETPS
jgi:carbon monoxide dehydrogenase subunit G